MEVNLSDCNCGSSGISLFTFCLALFVIGLCANWWTVDTQTDCSNPEGCKYTINVVVIDE